MPVGLVVGDVASFRKYVKYIGRAYQKRSVAMIQLCRLFLEISPGKPDQIDALRSLFETVEDALKSAVDAGKDRSDAADSAFATAEEELDWYAAWHHPKQQEVLGDVQNIIEDAAQKDSYIAKTHKRLSTRLGLNRSGSPSSSSLVKVHFQILRSPTDRREAPVVTCELGPDVKISELLWTFSRLPEDQRIGLKQNPHFYFSKDLSDQASVYDDQFKLEPLKDLRPEKDLVVMVLLDRAGQIFVDYQHFSKTFGNIWRPDNTIILKDLQGTLEAADLISPKISGEVCIWQRGGGRPAEEDLSKWTEVLDRALDLPDVDWLIRSETAPDEAFDIEVTGGWERCSPVMIPDPPGLSEEDDPVTDTLPHEDAPEEAPSPVLLLNNTVPTVGTASQEAFHPSHDTPPSSVTVEILSEVAQGIEEECPSIVQDKDSALDISSSLGSTPSQVEGAIHPPVNPAGTFLEPFTPSEESEPALASSAFAAEKTAFTAAESICSQNEPVHAQTSLSCSSSDPFTLHIDSIVASSSDVLTPLKIAPSDDTTASHTPVQSACAPPESTSPNTAEPTVASTPDRISEPARPQAETIRAPDHLGRYPSGHPVPFIGDTLEPASVMSTRSRTTTSDSTPFQAEVANLSNSPRPPIIANSAPIFKHTHLTPTPASDTVPLRSKIDHPVVQSARSPEYIVPPTGNRSTSQSRVPAPERIPPFTGRARSGSRVETVNQPLVVESPRAPPREPTLPVGKKQASHVGPSPLERIRAPVEATRSSNQNSSAPSKPRVSSVVTGGAPTFHRSHPSSERTNTQVETRPSVRHAYAPPPAGPRTSAGGQLRGVPVPDTKAVHLSSRRIKSHPRKMVTPGQRQSTVFSTQMNVPSPVMPLGLPVEHSTGSLGPSYANSAQLHTTLVGSHNHGTLPENRGGYQSYATRPGQPEVSVSISVSAPVASNGGARMSFQDSMGQSRRSTVIAGQISAQLARPGEKPVLDTSPSRNSPGSVGRQDRTVGALSQSFHAKSSNLVTIPEGQSALKGYSARPNMPAVSHAAAAKPNPPTSLPHNISRTSSVVNIKDSARKSTALPEQTTSQLAVRLQPITNPVFNSSKFSDPATMARLSNGFSVGSKVLPSPPVGGAAPISASPAWSSTARTPSRIKTKDLINRHKQQNANDARPTSTSESASPSRAPTSALSQTATLAGKSSANRTDSGIELWDYDDRRRGPDGSVNGHGNPSRDRGPSSPLPTSSPVNTRSTNHREDGTGSSLSSKKSRSSMLGSPSHVVSPTHSGNPMSTPEQVKNSLLNVTTGSSSTGSLASTSPGRREPFINRKPQPTSQSTSQGRATPQSGYSTPPRSSTPSSVSHSASTSTRATMVTPATSFSIPSRVPSPVTDVGPKSSWFRRLVIDPVKSKLGYGS